MDNQLDREISHQMKQSENFKVMETGGMISVYETHVEAENAIKKNAAVRFRFAKAFNCWS